MLQAILSGSGGSRIELDQISCNGSRLPAPGVAKPPRSLAGRIPCLGGANPQPSLNPDQKPRANTSNVQMPQSPGPIPSPLSARQRRIHRLALLVAALTVSIVALSAYLRLSQSGLGCNVWPSCYRQVAPVGIEVAGNVAVVAARLVHRVVASAVLVLVVILVLATLGMRPKLWREGRLTLGMLLLTLGLAALGAAARGSQFPAVVLGNLLGGFALLAVAWRLAGTTMARGHGSGQWTGWAWLALLLLMLQVALGGLVSATHSLIVCSSWAECSRLVQGVEWDWQVLNPWLGVGSDATVLSARGAWLQWLHRVGVLLVAPTMVVVGWIAWRSGQRAPALALGALLGLQLLLGILLGSTGAPLPVALAHNLVGAALIALLFRLAR